MAWIIGDSFDFYSGDSASLSGLWDSVASYSGWGISSTTRFSVGRSLTIGNCSNILTKAFGSNEATVFLAVAHRRDSSLSGTAKDANLQLLDGATAQCTVVFESSGNIVLKSGGIAGTVLATYSSAFAGAGAWNHFQIKVVINNTTGSITVRKNGDASDTFSATSLNTRGGTANNYANSLLVLGGNSVATSFFDDLLCYSAAGAAPNTWVGDVKAVQLMASADTAQKDFTASPTTITDTASSITTNNQAVAANFVWWTNGFTADCSGTVGTVTANFNAGITGSVKAAIYANDGAGGAPGTLLATSNAVVNPVLGTNAFTFGSPPAVVRNTSYRIGYLSDTAWTSKGGTLAAGQYTQSQSYGSGFPSPATPSSGTTYPLYGTATVTITNASNVGEAAQDGDTTYVYDSTSGHEDLYDLDNLTTTPTTIIAVQSRMFAKKSDSGTRNGQIRVKSGATEVGGTDTVLGTNYGWLNKVDTVDPNTSAAWTASAVNALQVGPKVTA